MVNLTVSEPEGIIIKDESTAIETYALIIPTFLLIYLVVVLSSHLCLNGRQRCILEFVILTIPTILVMTVLSTRVFEISLALLLLCLSVSFIPKVKYVKDWKAEPPVHKTNFLTNTRATTNFLTCVAILAVDFQIFPRRFTKNEKYGFSLMDLGVGLFVASNGIVAPELRHKISPLFSVFKSCIPLLILGFSRFVVLKEIDYKVSVHEYGVHWNFFITLAVTKMVCTAILKFVSVKHAFLVAVFLLLFHETSLQLGLAEYVLGDVERTNFFTANREGIVSCLGYVSLYFLSITFGLIFNNGSKGKRKICELLVSNFFLLVAVCVIGGKFGVSRRLANMGYCIWTTFISVSMTTLFYICDIIQTYIYEKHKVPCRIFVPLLLEAINYNGLVFFLVSNLLTGLVNILFDTLKINTVFSLVILTVYMFLTSLIIVILYVRKIKLKL